MKNRASRAISNSVRRMIHVASSVRVSSGGLFIPRVQYELAGIMQAREGESAEWSLVDAWSKASALRSLVVAELVSMGYLVEYSPV